MPSLSFLTLLLYTSTDRTHTHTHPYLISSLTSLSHLLFLHFPLLLGFPFPMEQKPWQLVCLPVLAPSAPSCPLLQPVWLAGWLASWRESWFYLFFCLFGKRAVAALGLAAARCALLRAVGRQPCWPPRNVAGTPCAVFTPLQLLGSTGQSQACPVAPGEPWTHSVLSGRPHVAFGGTNPSLASDLL